jgi:hypothetical protein
MKTWGKRIAVAVLAVVVIVGVAAFFMGRDKPSASSVSIEDGYAVYNVTNEAFYENYQSPEAGHEDDYINYLIDQLYRADGVYAGDGVRQLQ